MGPFQEFRTWARKAPAPERAFTAAAAVVVVALGAWLLVPGDEDSAGQVVATETGAGGAQQEGSATAPAGAGGTTAGTSGGAAVAGSGAGAGASAASGSGTGVSPAGAPDVSGGAAADAASTPSAGAAGAPAGCVSPPGSARGMTATEVRIAVGLSSIIGPAANELFGIPPPDEQRAAFAAIIDDLNANGGVACRKVVAEYYEVNPTDQAGMHEQCLDIAESGVYAVVDTGPFASITDEPLTCFASHQVSYFGAYFISKWLAQESYPYLFSFYTYEDLYRDTAFALKDRGYFERANGFRKLGVLVRTCKQRTIEVYFDSLERAGIGRDEMVTYDVGCPEAFASPADLAQAVLTFQRAGVTHVTGAGIVGDFANFTNIAERQGFRPKYGLPDEALIAITYGSQRPNYDNIDGAIAITESRLGEERTPGTVPTAGTARCNAILKQRGLPDAYEEPTVSGNACSQLWMFQAAVERAPSVDQTALGTGIQQAKSVEFSFPQGPNDFAGEQVTTGGQFWRPAEFHKSCGCWQVADRNFRPSYR